MKIISKFHDYYDIALSQGRDDSIIYLREEREEKFLLQYTGESYLNSMYKELPSMPSYGNYYFGSNKIHFIGFCGKMYPYIIFTHEAYEKNGALTITRRIIYNSNDAVDFFNCFNYKKDLESFLYPGKKDKKRFRWNKQDIFTKATFNNYIDKYSNKVGCGEIFIKYKVPVFLLSFDYFYNRVWGGKHVFEEGKLILNPCLKDIEFFRIINPYVAFQEIEMFLSGVLGFPAPPMIEITDKDKLAKQGFDKWSFRKMPTKKMK